MERQGQGNPPAGFPYATATPPGGRATATLPPLTPPLPETCWFPHGGPFQGGGAPSPYPAEPDPQHGCALGLRSVGPHPGRPVPVRTWSRGPIPALGAEGATPSPRSGLVTAYAVPAAHNAKGGTVCPLLMRWSSYPATVG